MENKEKVLEVKNLRISFKTNTGTVKAVRGINFNLYKGKTLAIVGESGSGKSVTSKAILGILANNKIVEDGQIIYDGKDLLRISEDTFTHIRGVKISMIFQDPLSSLNPIMKVGKQLTEAMYLKAKATKREAKLMIKKFNKIFKQYSTKEEFTAFNKTISEITLNDDSSKLNDYKDLFMNSLSHEIERQKTSIELALKALKDLTKKYFKNEKSFNSKECLKEVEQLAKILKECAFRLEFSPDDIIEVFSISLKEYIHSFDDAIVRTAKREELLKNHNVDSLYDLPSSIRAKEREVIVTSSKYFNLMCELIESLDNHLNDLLKNKKYNAETLFPELVEGFFNVIRSSKESMSNAEAKEKAITLLKEVGINDPERRYNQYPFEFSGGMRQRIVIAIALSSNPEVLICDEPTTALDVTIQAQILELINKLKAEKNLSIIFITHDLGVVANMADDIAVMYAGKIVEQGSVYDIFYDPRHPYTWALLGSMPDLTTTEKLDAIPGTPPNMLLPPKGDAFASRNKYALEIDYEEEPPFYEVSPTHQVASWLVDENAPDVDAPKIVVDRIKNSLKKNSANKPTATNKKNSIIFGRGGKKGVE